MTYEPMTTTIFRGGSRTPTRVRCEMTLDCVHLPATLIDAITHKFDVKLVFADEELRQLASFIIQTNRYVDAGAVEEAIKAAESEAIDIKHEIEDFILNYRILCEAFERHVEAQLRAAEREAQVA